MEAAGRVDVSNRPPTCADRNQINHRNQYRVTADVGIAGIHDLDVTVRNRADVSRSAADIYRDHVAGTAPQSL